MDESALWENARPCPSGGNVLPPTPGVLGRPTVLGPQIAQPEIARLFTQRKRLRGGSKGSRPSGRPSEKSVGPHQSVSLSLYRDGLSDGALPLADSGSYKPPQRLSDKALFGGCLTTVACRRRSCRRSLLCTGLAYSALFFLELCGFLI